MCKRTHSIEDGFSFSYFLHLLGNNFRKVPDMQTECLTAYVILLQELTKSQLS